MSQPTQEILLEAVRADANSWRCSQEQRNQDAVKAEKWDALIAAIDKVALGQSGAIIPIDDDYAIHLEHQHCFDSNVSIEVCHLN